MKIGEFASSCGIPISVLRYYDSYGLLKPVYIDRFTGYRYYSERQIVICEQISKLKAADFSLAEIKMLISGGASDDEINSLFDSKKKRLNEILQSLDELRDIISGGNLMAEEIKLMHENVHIPFENDEKIIGRWEVIGEYGSRTEFEIGNKLNDDIDVKIKELYFLPEGEWYWCYSWTKGKLLFDNGDISFANDYTVEKHSDAAYMFIKFKSYYYLKS